MTSDAEVAIMAFFGGKFDFFLCYLVNTESRPRVQNSKSEKFEFQTRIKPGFETDKSE